MYHRSIEMDFAMSAAVAGAIEATQIRKQLALMTAMLALPEAERPAFLQRVAEEEQALRDRRAARWSILGLVIVLALAITITLVRLHAP